jgi:hypothetical protein
MQRHFHICLTLHVVNQNGSLYSLLLLQSCLWAGWHYVQLSVYWFKTNVLRCVFWSLRSVQNIGSVTDKFHSRFHWRWTSATFSNLIYHFKMDFHSSNVNRAPAIFFHYHTSYVLWSYSHVSSDICWENTMLHIVMIIQFNFENSAQIPSVKVCIHIFGGPCSFIIL